MKRISYKRHRFPPEVIQFAVWACLRFTMSLRDVEDLLAYCGIEVSTAAALKSMKKLLRWSALSELVRF